MARLYKPRHASGPSWPGVLVRLAAGLIAAGFLILATLAMEQRR